MDIKDIRESVWCGTGSLKLGRYLSNADSVRWDFCLARQHGLATGNCVKIFTIFSLWKSFLLPFYLSLYLGLVFLLTCPTFKQVPSFIQGFLWPPFCRTLSLWQFQIIHLDCTWHYHNLIWRKFIL